MCLHVRTKKVRAILLTQCGKHKELIDTHFCCSFGIGVLRFVCSYMLFASEKCYFARIIGQHYYFFLKVRL